MRRSSKATCTASIWTCHELWQTISEYRRQHAVVTSVTVYSAINYLTWIFRFPTFFLTLQGLSFLLQPGSFQSYKLQCSSLHKFKICFITHTKRRPHSQAWNTSTFCGTDTSVAILYRSLIDIVAYTVHRVTTLGRCTKGGNHIDYNGHQPLIRVILLPGAELPLVKVLAFSTTSFHFPRSWTQAIQFWFFNWQMSCLMLSYHLYLGLPCDLLVRGFQLNIFSNVLVSGILCTWPNQLSLWALSWLELIIVKNPRLPVT